MMGKHSEQCLKIKQLEETIALKDQEIKDIKFSVADILLQNSSIKHLYKCFNAILTHKT